MIWQFVSYVALKVNLQEEQHLFFFFFKSYFCQIIIVEAKMFEDHGWY